jgi:exopolyphosphatase / guanosine-5'-triphosphate,3'-diphosphate pyrophosphatase
MRIATVDVGTNSVLLLIVEPNPQGELVAVVEQATITRLGQGVDRTRSLHPDAVERTLACLRQARSVAEQHHATITRAVGTSALRDAHGAQAFLREAQQILGTSLEVISGNEEARLTCLGALSGLTLPSESFLICDIGGGSTELVVGTKQHSELAISWSQSLDIGSVRLTERCLATDPPTSEEIQLLSEQVDQALASLPVVGTTTLVGLAGTITTIAAIANKVDPYQSELIHGAQLSLEKIQLVTKQLATSSLEQRKHTVGLNPLRADVIVAGAVLFERVLLWAHVSSVLISDRGVRWGLAMDSFLHPPV